MDQGISNRINQPQVGHAANLEPIVSSSHCAGDHATVPHGISTYHGVPAFGLLAHAARQLPERTAVVYGQQHWTYSELNQESIRAAAALQKLGVKPGDRVGILLPNVPEYIISTNAIWLTGGIVVAISPLMVAREVDALIEKTGCRIVICLDMLSQNVTDDNVQLLLVSIREHLQSIQQVGYLWERHTRTGRWTLPADGRSKWFWKQLELCDHSLTPVTITPKNDPALILPTGGTTGMPRPVLLSHANLVANAWQQYQWTQQSFGKESMLAIIPFFHGYGMSATLLGASAMAATLILHHRFQTQKVVSLMQEHQPTIFHAVPSMLSALNKRFGSRKQEITKLKWVISGGSALDTNTAAEFSQHTGALVVEGYGLSEASPVTHVGHLFREPVYGTIGLPLPETECRIVDNDQQDLAEGQAGELLIRGPQVMLGYWNDPQATAIAIQDGWLHTGDLATRDEHGVYRIVGRKKDLIITNSLNVYPAEVEDVLNEYSDIAEAAVIGVPDDRRGEIVKAIIVMKRGAEYSVEKIQQHCEARLSTYKRPRVFECRQQPLPRNFKGELQRYQLGDKE